MKEPVTQIIDEVVRLREQNALLYETVLRCRAHTRFPMEADRYLLIGLLASIERICDTALAHINAGTKDDRLETLRRPS